MSLKYCFGFSVVFFILCSLAKADTLCSDAIGAFQYKETNYSGGQAPRPGTLLRSVQLVFQKNIISESFYYEHTQESSEERSEPNDQIGPIQSDFSKFNQLSEVQLPYGIEQTYSAFIQFTLLRNNEASSIVTPTDRFVICQKNQYFYP